MSSLTARIRTTVAADSAAKLAAPLTASHLQHSPRARRCLSVGARNVANPFADEPSARDCRRFGRLGLVWCAVREGLVRIQLRFWMLLAAVLGADAAAIYGVHVLVEWVRRVMS